MYLQNKVLLYVTIIPSHVHARREQQLNPCMSLPVFQFSTGNDCYDNDHNFYLSCTSLLVVDSSVKFTSTLTSCYKCMLYLYHSCACFPLATFISHTFHVPSGFTYMLYSTRRDSLHNIIKMLLGAVRCSQNIAWSSKL